MTLGGTSLAKGAKRHPTLGRGVIVGANSQVLGGFTVGDGARVGSNAVVLKEVPPGATAVGNPARIIQAERDAAREAAAAKMGFSAYGITQGDDPLARAMSGLIDNAAGQGRYSRSSSGTSSSQSVQSRGTSITAVSLYGVM